MNKQVERARRRWPLSAIVVAMAIGIMSGGAVVRTTWKHRIESMQADMSVLHAQIDNLHYDLQYCRAEHPRPERIMRMCDLETERQTGLKVWACHFDMHFDSSVAPPPLTMMRTQAPFWEAYDDAHGHVDSARAVDVP